MSKRVVLTFEVSFMSIMCLDLISCVSPSLVLQRGHRFGLNSLILSILSGIWRAYPLCPLSAPKGLVTLFEFALIFIAFLRLGTFILALLPPLSAIFSTTSYPSNCILIGFFIVVTM